MDKLLLKQMKFYGYHGVFPEETRLGQAFHVDLEIDLDLSKAGKSDALENTINYAEMIENVRHIVEGKPYQLIEALGESIASLLLQTYTMINEVMVRVTKPNPPVPVHFDGVAIELRRKRSLE